MFYILSLTFNLVATTQLFSSAHRIKMVIICTKFCQIFSSSLKVMQRSQNVDYKHLNLKCDLDLGVNNTTVALCTSPKWLLFVPSYFFKKLFCNLKVIERTRYNVDILTFDILVCT